MKREILFRGLKTDGSGWVKGYLYRVAGVHYITNETDTGYAVNYPVHPDTVGQFVKETVYRGTKMRVFVGDKVKVILPYDENVYTAEVIYDESFSAFRYLVNIKNGKYYHNFGVIQVVEIIGTIHDDKEATP
jgi:hypothetical protein